LFPIPLGVRTAFCLCIVSCICVLRIFSHSLIPIISHFLSGRYFNRLYFVLFCHAVTWE
jgi:hypothetical protein